MDPEAAARETSNNGLAGTDGAIPRTPSALPNNVVVEVSGLGDSDRRLAELGYAQVSQAPSSHSSLATMGSQGLHCTSSALGL